MKGYQIMKKLSQSLLANLVTNRRKEKHMTQQDLADITGINRSMISRLEKEDFIPSIPQLEQLGETLDFEPQTLFVDLKQYQASFSFTFKYRGSRNRICRIIHRDITCTA